VIDRFVDDLATQLAELGVKGERAERFVEEARDHLLEAARDGEEEAIRRFGPSGDIARLIAAEVATAETRAATLATFGALALVGLGYVAVLMLVPAAGGWPDIFGGRIDAIGPISGVALAVLPQIAFVSGCLALLRALRLREAPVVADPDLRLLRRRSIVATAAAAGALAAVAAYALNFGGSLAAWWTWTAVATCTLLVLPLGAAAIGIARSSVPAAASGGPAGDVFDDLSPLFDLRPVRALELPQHSWRFAILCAAAAGLVGLVGGWYAEGDPGSGLVRGGFEALALLACFGLLGRQLGLRR
jgi:HAAS